MKMPSEYKRCLSRRAQPCKGRDKGKPWLVGEGLMMLPRTGTWFFIIRYNMCKNTHTLAFQTVFVDHIMRSFEYAFFPRKVRGK